MSNDTKIKHTISSAMEMICTFYKCPNGFICDCEETFDTDSISVSSKYSLIEKGTPEWKKLSILLVQTK